MKTVALLCLLSVSFLTSCDLRSDTAKREMEKFSGTPTPTRTPMPAEIPIDPADVIRAETDVPGETISVAGSSLKRTISCSKFNRVMINGSRNVISVKGACKSIMVNGDGNQLISDGAVEFVINGETNTVNYSRFVNGKRPIVSDNAGGNVIEKTSPPKAVK